MTARSTDVCEQMSVQTALDSDAGAIDVDLNFFDDFDTFPDLVDAELPCDAAMDIAASLNDDSSTNATASSPPASAPIGPFSALLHSDAPVCDPVDLGSIELLLLEEPMAVSFEPETTETTPSLELPVSIRCVSDSKRPMLSDNPGIERSQQLLLPSRDRSRQPAATMMKSTKTKKISSTQRLKEELIFLRDKVAALESELTRLEATRSSTDSSRNDIGNRSLQGDGITDVNLAHWKTLADRQRDAKRDAETENKVLRQRLTGQLKFAKSLERMLRKRRVRLA